MEQDRIASAEKIQDLEFQDQAQPSFRIIASKDDKYYDLTPYNPLDFLHRQIIKNHLKTASILPYHQIYTNQDVQVIHVEFKKPKIKNISNLLSNSREGIQLKPCLSSMRLRLEIGLYTTARNIFEGSLRFGNIIRNLTTRNPLALEYYSILKEFILSEEERIKHFLRSFEGNRRNGMKCTLYDNDHLKVYFIDRVLEDLLSLYVDFLLAGFPDCALEEVLRVIINNPETFDVEKMSRFLKNMCFEVMLIKRITEFKDVQ